MLECVMKYSKPRSDAESLDTQSLLRRPDCVKKDFTSFIGQMNEKYNYVGIVQGLCKNSSEIQVVKNLCVEMRQSCIKKKQKQLKEAMLKAAAFITLMKTKGKFNFFFVEVHTTKCSFLIGNSKILILYKKVLIQIRT